MSKCHVKELSNVYKAIFTDALHAFPALKDEFERDLARLSKAIEQRGLPLLVADLPAAGKHLDRCLSSGEYKLSGLPLTKRYSNRTVIPAFCRGLYLLIFDDKGALRNDYNVEAILFLRQILLVGKKTALPCSPKKLENTVREFFEVDSELPIPESFWDGDYVNKDAIREVYQGFGKSTMYSERINVPLEDLEGSVAGTPLPASCPRFLSHSRDLSSVLTKLDLVSGIVCATLGSYTPEEWSFRHGPGAIAEATGPTNKYYWDNWSDRLESEFPIADCGFHNYSAWADRVSSEFEVGSRDPSSRLVAVPKTFKAPRLIAAEPSEHQWCQQNIWHYIDTRVEQSWINGFIRFRDQTHNQELCIRGSEDGSLVTVDLSAASDRVTCHAVGQMFRSNPNLLLALRATRTRFCEQKLVKTLPTTLALRKFSTMGSACTFPIQSLMFLSIALSCVLRKRNMKVTTKNIKSLVGQVAVFGDDIIIPADSRELLFDTLKVLHFKVNADKSYWNGNFRESCGVDSFGGVNVTPAYWKSPFSGKPESVASTVAVANNFHRKYMLATAAHVASTIRSVGIPIVPMDSGVMGLNSFSRPFLRGCKTRENEFLQRTEALLPVLYTRVKKLRSDDDSELLQFFTENPDPQSMWSGGVAQRPALFIKRRWVDIALIGAQPIM